MFSFSLLNNFNYANTHSLTADKLILLKDMLKENKLNELILEGESLKTANQESIPLRTLLFKAYLYSNFLVKANEELSFIETRIKNDETIYLRALEAIHTNDLSTGSTIDKIINLLATIKDRRYAPPYLLRTELYTLKKQFTIAREELNIYRSLEGESEEWFFNYGKFLLRFYKNNKTTTIATEIRKHIERYAKVYPANHEQMFLKAEYYAAMEQFDYALQYIDQAIYLSYSKDEYLDKKLYYLYRSQQFKKLVDFISSLPGSDLGNLGKKDLIHYEWVRSFINFINFKNKNKLFSLVNQSTLQSVIEPLKNILAVNPEQEVIRFFLEELLLANTDQKDKAREIYADYHYLKAQESFKRARIDEARFELERMIALAPFNSAYRSAYMEHLRFSELFELYHLEAQNYKKLFTNIPQNQLIRFQMAEQMLQEGLANHYHISTPLSSPQINGLLVYTQRSYKDSWNQPYLESIVARMLQVSHANLPHISLSTTSTKDLNKQSAHDYEIHFSLNDQNDILTVNFKILDPARLTIFNEDLSFFGKDRYAKMITKWKAISLEIFPKVGRVSAVVDRQAVISIGKVHGANEGDKVQLLKNGVVQGEFNLLILNNYYSLITIDKIFTLSKTEIGDILVLVPNTK